MPKTAAQLDVLKSFMTSDAEGDEDWDYDHIGMDIDASGEYTWRDGTAVDKDVLGDVTNHNDKPVCGEDYTLHWGHDDDVFYCVSEDPEDGGMPHDDGKQLCQLTLNECD